MASIADVYISVIPETSKVADGIRRAFKEVDKDAREAGQRWGREIKGGIGDIKPDVKPETVSAKTELEKFRREEERKKIRQQIEFDEGGAKEKLALMRKEFEGVGGNFASAGKWNLGLAAIGTLPAAATAIADVAGAVQQLAGAGLVLPGVFAGILSSAGVAALGVHGMSDAFTALDKASNGTKASVDAANAALAKLPASSADAIKTVYGLKGTFQELQKLASGNLFQGFSGGLKDLATADLPAVTRGIDGISKGLNQNLLQAMKSLGSGSSQSFMERIFGNTGSAQGKLTAAIDPIVHAFGTLAAAGSDSLPRLADAVGRVAERFNKFITSADGDGRLEKWIREGLDGFTNLGNIVLNLGKSFTAVTQAAGGGQGLLSTLRALTERMSTFLNSTEGQNKLAAYFAQGRDMLGQLMNVAVQIGPLLGGIFNAGISSANLWLPIIREVLADINAIPGGAQAVVTAFVAWKTIQGPIALIGSLNNIVSLLRIALPAAAATGGAGLASGLAPATAALGGLNTTALALLGSFAALPAAAGGFLYAAQQISDHASPEMKAGIDQDSQSGKEATANRLRDILHPPTGGSLSSDTLSHLHDGYTVKAPIPGMNAVTGAYTTPPSPWGPPSAPVVVPPLSTYSPPVITQPSGGAAANLPFTGTANPYGSTGSGGYTSDAALLANVPAGQYGRDKGADLTKGLGDCSSAVEDLVNLMNGQSTAGASMSTGNEAQWLTDHGFVLNATGANVPGAMNVGFNSEHTQATLPGGTNFNWGSPGAAARGGVGGTGAFDPAFTSHYYLPTSSGNPASAMYGDGSTPGTGLTSSDLSLRNAQQRVDDSQHSVEDAQASMDALNAKGTATAKQRADAEYNLGRANREHKDALDALTVAQDKYNKSAQSGKGGADSSGMQGLGTDLMGGIAQFFGFDGSLFKNPADFGIMKFITGAANLKVKGGDGASGGAMPAGGGGGLGGLLGMAQSFMPSAPGGGNSQNLLDAVQSGQPGQGAPNSPGPGNGYQNSGIDLRGAQLGVNPADFNQQLSSITSSQNRWGPLLQNAPK